MFEVGNLAKRSSGMPALNGVTFKARAGERAGFLGPNGKSTTVKIVTGWLETSEGEVLYNGRNTRKAEDRLCAGRTAFRFVSHRRGIP